MGCLVVMHGWFTTLPNTSSCNDGIKDRINILAHMKQILWLVGTVMLNTEATPIATCKHLHPSHTHTPHTHTPHTHCMSNKQSNCTSEVSAILPNVNAK